tara:strand:+ start:711 stop:818 length:108 start_codon:yes stop_codon:yes gene_type:complete
MNLVGEHESTHTLLDLEDVVVHGVDGLTERITAVM